MGMPSINIIFRELAKTFEQRNDNGIVALVLANNSGMNPKEYRPEMIWMLRLQKMQKYKSSLQWKVEEKSRRK